MYAGLTISDKPALLDAKNYGKWIAKDSSGILYAYRNKPIKKQETGEWYDMTWVSMGWIYISFIQWSDAEPVNIDLALAQIAEMESAEKPMTNGEKILEQYASSIKRFASSRVEGKQINGKLRYYRFGVEKGYETLARGIERGRSVPRQPVHGRREGVKLCRYDFKAADGVCVLDGKPCEEDCNYIVEIDESPRTVKSVLLERWAKDTEAMARVTVWEKYNILSRTFVFENFATQSFHEAVGYMIAYLNSAAEVGK